jgi:Tfp pilus assembly protein PilP
MKKFYILLTSIIAVLGAYLLLESNEVPSTPKKIINDGIMKYKEKNNISKEQENFIRLQLAISNYISTNTKPPKNLEELVPNYFDSLPIDPATGKTFKYQLVGKSYKLGEETTGQDGTQKSDPKAATNTEAGKDDFVNPNKIEMEDFVYDSNGKRDPFKPFTEKEQTVVDETAPPLQRYELAQLRVAAILSDSNGGKFAMVEDATGIGYSVKLGEIIGTKKGKVVNIEADKVEVLESITNAAGQVSQELKILKLVSGGGKASNLKNRPTAKPKFKK